MPSDWSRPCRSSSRPIALVIASAATTVLRAAALPFAFLAVLTLPSATTPDVLVSEDGRLVAAPIGDGRLAVNRARPSQFTLDNWKRALASEELLGPRRVAPRSPHKPHNPDRNSGPGDSSSDPAFMCSDGVCLLEHPSGTRIAHAENAVSARRICADADLIVVADASARDLCPNSSAAILTTRQLARLGSAAIFLAPLSQGERQVAKIRHAVSEPYRPWHVQRQFSREARGLPPYRRNETGKRTPEAAMPATQPMRCRSQTAVNQ